jgi:hypothetical protein
MSEIWNRFKRTWNDGVAGFGRHSYNDAINAGYTPAQISAGIMGKRIGVRAQDMLNASQPAYGSGYSSGQSAAASQYENQLAGYRDQIAGYNQQISDFNNRIANYDTQIAGFQTRVADLTGQYNTAIAERDQNATDRDEFQRQFREASDLYEQEKLTADRYREEAVNNQLRAVRGGVTAGAGTQDQQNRGSLSSGKTGYSSDDKDISDLAESMKSQGGLTDSVLSREGPVVQQLAGGGGGRTSSGNQRNSQNSAGTGSYYASRFR